MGEPIEINIIGADGIITRTRTKKVELFVKDTFGVETYVDCILLDEVCDKALPISTDIITDCGRLGRLELLKIFTNGGDIDFLVGMSSPELHRQISMKKLSNGFIGHEKAFWIMYCWNCL